MTHEAVDLVGGQYKKNGQIGMLGVKGVFFFKFECTIIMINREKTTWFCWNMSSTSPHDRLFHSFMMYIVLTPRHKKQTACGARQTTLKSTHDWIRAFRYKQDWHSYIKKSINSKHVFIIKTGLSLCNSMSIVVERILPSRKSTHSYINTIV